ncbi:MAG: chloramphenicol resistance protein [Bacilli bacterium]|nr:chloramphenicol resistance protein [Bacilli bacterium]
MEEKAIIECIKDYFKGCPYLDNKNINIDFLGDEGESFSIEEVPASIITKRFIDGSKEKQCLFVLASRLFFGGIENQHKIDNLHLFEKISNWLESNTEKDVLPTLNNKQTATSIEALSSGYLFGTDKVNKYARYQIQCKLIYEEDV